MNTLPDSSEKSISEWLQSSNVVAIVGLSSNRWRTSNHIGEYLVQNRFKIIPVNPNEEEVFGEPSFNSILDLPDNQQVDIVVIFRNKEYTTEMVREIAEWSKRSGQKPLVWTQLDVSTDEAMRIAKEAGLEYVENRCIMVEHRSK